MKINVAVLFGGKTVEHEISVISAAQAVNALDAEKYNVFPIYISKTNIFYFGKALTDINAFKDLPLLLKKCVRIVFVSQDGKTYVAPAAKSFFSRNRPVAQIDVAFPIVHGANVEDGALQGFLRILGLPFVGCDILPSALCMDKFYAKTLLKQAGFPVLDCLRIRAADYKTLGGTAKTIENAFSYPVIIKPVNSGSSVGISLVKNAGEMADALDLAFSFANAVIAEKAVDNLIEINCAVSGDAESAEASECERPVAADGFLSYNDKYLAGGKKTAGKGMTSLKRVIPADVSPDLAEKIKKTSVEAFKFLNCAGVARIDYLTDGKTGEFWLNEINTIPGSLSFYLWEPLGVTYSALLDKLIQLALKRRREESEIIHSLDVNILSGGPFGGKGPKC